MSPNKSENNLIPEPLYIEEEYVPIIIWKYNENLIQLVKDSFDVVDIFTFNFNEDNDELKNKMEQLYFPHKIRESDERIHSKQVKLIVLKLTKPRYEIFSRKEHKNKPLNKSIIDFKDKTRKQYDFTYFHSPDYLNESQKTFEVFKINKYITNTKFININDLVAVVLTDKPKKVNGVKKPYAYEYRNISNTPQYLYLLGNKDSYRIISEKRANNVEKYKNYTYNDLINELPKESILKNINLITIPVYFDKKNKKYIIRDGIHRSSLYLFNNISYIKCKVIDDNFVSKFFITNSEIFFKET